MTDLRVDSITPLRQELITVYRELPTAEKVILQLFSLFYHSVSRSLVLDCLQQLAQKHEQYEALPEKTLESHINSLLEEGLLLQKGNQGPRCNPLVVEVVTRDAIEVGNFATLLAVAKEKLLPRERGGYFYIRGEQVLSQLARLGIYAHDWSFIGEVMKGYERFNYGKPDKIIEGLFAEVGNNPFEKEWFRSLPPQMFEMALSNILIKATANLTPAEEALELLREECSQEGEKQSHFLHFVLLEQLIIRGKLQEAEEILGRFPQNSEGGAVFWGWLKVLRGDYKQAITYYKQALKSLRKRKRKRKIYFSTIGGVFFILALLKEGSPQSLQDAEQHVSFVSRDYRSWLQFTYILLEKVIKVLQGSINQQELLHEVYDELGQDKSSWEKFFCFICLYWVDMEELKKRPTKLLKFYKQASQSGYNWFALEAAEILAHIKPRSSYDTQVKILAQDEQISPVVNILRPQAPWELSLNALAQLNQPQTSATNQRLAWFITLYFNKWSLQPREQKINAKGQWSKGRVIALKRLYKDLESFSYLTPQDIKICNLLEGYSSSPYGYYTGDYKFNKKALIPLIGHPLVFWEDSPTTQVEVVKGEPKFMVKQGNQGNIILELSPQPQENEDLIVEKETLTRIRVIEIKEEHRQIAAILGENNRLEVPNKAREQVLTALNGIAHSVTVHSDIGAELENAVEVEADPTPHVHLLPMGEGLKMTMLNCPFPQGESYYYPGQGGATVITEIKGERLQTTRDLPKEQELTQEAIAACPLLKNYPQEDGEWFIEEPEDCLELLLQLKELGEQVVVAWPEGEKMKVSHSASFDNLHLKIRRQQDWFATSGELKLSDDLVMDMQQLLELLKQTPGRFVPLGDGQFLALTKAFRKRLGEFQSFSEKHKGGQRFHPLAGLALEDFFDEVSQVKADKHWRQHRKKLREIEHLEPEVPSTLKAELRDYQIDGFRWLARLSHWGVGACLADDMGLGKTLQALAVILLRASEGPTLVIAPTSVCYNWLSEAERFAPTLNPKQFGNADRQKVLDQLQPFDLLVCSYGLLQQEEVGQILAEVSWQNIVLDEGQFIKNFATKRSKAAMKLQGQFKLITTGTPLENHLGELWNLFQFINPGLLGSLQDFNQNFAVPIEKYKDKQARNTLKKLIQPFLLRRTKNQVLTELPPRTEIVLHVELTKEEMALYEALRREAIAKLDDSEVTAGQKHLQILAELMKLRRCCCHPSLAVPETDLPGSKLQVFGEILTELRENGHKALIFSQFVSHLEIIRTYLDGEKVPYQYLDGSTPNTQRQKRVKAFQSGEGEVFLISLKAGGTGLNLTAADYVIHMDPWWNPAVEDQASDRAHRLGQQRPVTIYRLVAKDTIEDKIVALHHHKRDLADSLLEDSDLSGKMSTDELLQLITG